ncbi:glycosyltransferase family 4 protein [uncultured Deefgea sp.]|uniref:glycosyltransferase family 4 protein n=1 Tax=uncultured Deefgea sp. TaxID=1304914 RepID=UPI0026294ED1|nr:glycosyltransferase family 4 protein [uncultured Deefgea sp.]
MRHLLYILHSGQLYGTERMALATLNQLTRHGIPVLFAPAGPVHQEAKRQGIQSHIFYNKWSLARVFWPYLSEKDNVLFTTAVTQSLLALLLSKLRGIDLPQLHIVHGGTDERLSYARKHWLQHLGLPLVAVSDFVRERLLAHHCSEQGVKVIENFLIGHLPQRAPFQRSGIAHVALVSRIDPIKEVGVAIAAWRLPGSLGMPRLLVMGTGWQSQALIDLSVLNERVSWFGFVQYPAEIVAECDLYVHTCPCEPFGLAILEAMAIGLPVLVPDQGGAASLVEDGVTGFHFRASDPYDLQRQVLRINELSPAKLNAVVAAARQQLSERFSAQARISDYARLLNLSESI